MRAVPPTRGELAVRGSSDASARSAAAHGGPPTLGIAHETGVELLPNSARVVARLFVPGLEEVGPTGSRAGAVIDRILKLSERAVEEAVADVEARFSFRHRDLGAIFDANADKVITLLDPDIALSPVRRRFLGACFTHEYSVEAAALCNPSMVLFPDTDATRDAQFVMSVRGIGEGHRSSIGFRTGTITTSGTVSIDTPSPYAHTVSGTPGRHHRSVFHYKLDLLGDDFENVAHVLNSLPPTFDDATLTTALDAVAADVAIRRLTPTTIAHITALAHWSYEVRFPADTAISERVLWPSAPPEFHGMEDARFVRFVGDDGAITYYATYTAFDRRDISVQLLETTDFVTFSSSPVAGAAAAGKGLALFPRKVQGRYLALTRADRETNGIASSDDLHHWANSETLQAPRESWEVLQLGNCGSPVETSHGWLVLTHGVGPVRTYTMGALLLDLDEPTRVLRRATLPLLAAGTQHRDGYVPNVVYSCGAVAHGDTLVIPYGVSDERISIATVSVDELVAAMVDVR